MKEELVNNWIDNLESGDYKKGKNNLCMDNEYCCLGILADINGDLHIKKSEYDVNYGVVGVNEEDYLTDEIIDKYGMEDIDQYILSRVNDRSETFESVVEAIKDIFIKKKDKRDVIQSLDFCEQTKKLLLDQLD